MKLPLLLLLTSTIACNGQNNKLSMNSNNPLMCDVQTGLCEIPGTEQKTPVSPKPVRIIYFTDPICSSCWGIEPALRRLKLEYGDVVEIEYHMGGLLPSWDVYNSGGISKPSDVAHHWDEVSLHYDMPIDGDVWLEDPLPSSYPPSVAFKAAQLQDGQKAIQFLRRIREMVFLEKKNITKWEHLEQAAKQVGLNVEQFKADYEGRAQTLFQEDLNLGRSLNVRSFPTLIFSDAEEQKLVLKGVRPYEHFEQTLLALFPKAMKNVYDNRPEALFQHYPTLTTREFEVLAGVSKEQAKKTLQQMQEKGMLKVYQTKNGVLWMR
ncbi:MAG TPA: ClpXP adapter SpxH family protein [Saprospiraceae bacterium]|nr:ClpXP adapter SpxH family protein [Saprospiraceae bacterium]